MDAGEGDTGRGKRAPGGESAAAEAPRRGQLRKLSRKHAKKLRRSFRLAREGDQDGVHDLRVATRRLQAITQLLDPEGKSKEIKWLRRRLRRLRHAVGEERDLRLFTETARRRASRAASPAWRRVWRQISGDLAAEFEQASRNAHKRLRRRSADALARKIKRAVHKDAARISAGEIAATIEKARDKLAASLQQADSSHAVSGYHHVRIKAKSLRYLLEIRAKLAAKNHDNGAIELLKSVQDELGDWHDEVELCRRATAALSADAERQADAAATEVLEAMRRRAGVINQHAGEVVGRLHDALGRDGLKARPAPAHQGSAQEKH